MFSLFYKLYVSFIEKSSVFLTTRSFVNKNVKYKLNFQDTDVIDLTNLMTGVDNHFNQLEVKINCLLFCF